ncbi:MAG: hydantoinase/oxoprolinase family protein [Alphaproteobacteria bacterium]|jgi:N-methylhydantoinase A
MPSASKKISIAVDIGGTFTDIVLADRSTNSFFVTKTSSTPDNPAVGFFEAIDSVIKLSNANKEDIEIVFHGSTVATNAILENKGVKTALITSKGFRHVLEIGRAEIPREANLYGWTKPKRPVLPRDIFEISERVRSNGSVARPLNKDDLESVVTTISKGGYEAVAICLMHSYMNSAHEQIIDDFLKKNLPGLEVSISSDVLPVFREYERTMATVMNAMVQPLVGKYVSQLEAGLKERNIQAPMLIMKSNGGVFPPMEAARSGAHMALSGPAAGAIGAAYLGNLCKIKDMITIDIGGTSADISLIQDGQAAVTTSTKINELPLSLPVIDIHTIGAGGGSIASISESGAILVGPKSAGAYPGPASYGKGGLQPTVTDANLVLGRLPPKLLDGEVALNKDAAQHAIQEHIAEPLGISVQDAAIGILAIVNETMNNALKLMTVERGLNPKDFTLVAFGGAGPVHGGELMRLLGCQNLLLPRYPGILCATGLLSTDLRYDFATTRVQRSGQYNEKEILEIFDKLSDQALSKLLQYKLKGDTYELKRSVDLRYAGQGTELTVPFSDKTPIKASIESAINEFHRFHGELYNFADKNAGVELINFRITATSPIQHVPPPEIPNAKLPQLPESTFRYVTLNPNGPQKVPVWKREMLLCGHSIDGPAVIDQLDTTSIILAGQKAKVDNWGNIMISEVLR